MAIIDEELEGLADTERQLAEIVAFQLLRIKHLEKASRMLFDMVHESDDSELKELANELLEIIEP